MEERMVDFVHALRASGVRVSLAESEDAFRASAFVVESTPRCEPSPRRTPTS